MMVAVAGRFNFPSGELFSMPIRMLKFWYQGHVDMYNEEKNAMNDK
jgi:hypothetical protein